MALITWGSVAGVPVHYARDLTPSLRNPGRPVTSWRSTASFKAELDETFEELWSVCGLGRADVIVSAGAFVDRNVAGSSKKSAHAAGRAFDVDGIIWNPTATSPGHRFYSVDFAAQPQFYWGVCAVFSRRLRHVLHAAYNHAHHDHIHVEDTREPRFARGSRAMVGYVQSALTHVHASPVTIDGRFGSQTAVALAAVLGRLGIGGSIDDLEPWRRFNLATARIGLSAFVAPDGDDPDRADDPSPEVAGTPEGEHERPPGERPLGRRLLLTSPRMRGEDVGRVQDALRLVGVEPGPVDGWFGPLTRAGVVAFQLRQGLVPDGVVGPVTAAALDRLVVPTG